MEKKNPAPINIRLYSIIGSISEFHWLFLNFGNAFLIRIEYFFVCIILLIFDDFSLIFSN